MYLDVAGIPNFMWGVQPQVYPYFPKGTFMFCYVLFFYGFTKNVSYCWLLSVKLVSSELCCVNVAPLPLCL